MLEAPPIHESSTVLLVDDDPRIREAVRTLLASEPSSGFALVDTAATVAQGAGLARRLEPDVLLLDLGLPDGCGTEVLAALAPAARTVTIVLTVFDDDGHIFDALRAGAAGYLLKDEIVSRLLPSMRDVLAGGAPMCPSIARRVLESFRPRPSQAPEPAAEHEALTAREREVLEHLARGATYDEIARLLGMATNTVRTHIRAIYRKLSATSKVGAMREAMRRGLLRRG